jgi:ubiquinone/menaquinone biosynthesis C-methylase UbiE
MENPANAKFYNKLTLRIFEDKFVSYCKKYVKGSMIDIGCGKKPYAPVLKSYVTEHIGVDHPGTLHDKSNIDVFGTAYEIPLESNYFDSAICTAVLEHLEEPEMAIRECHRVLKQGGVAIYSMPFIWHLHEEPRDFFRYSKYGLKYLFEKGGFQIVEMIPLSGFIVTFIQMKLYYLKRFDRGVIRWLGLFRAYAWIMQKIGFFLNKYDKSYKWTWMYIVVARKA